MKRAIALCALLIAVPIVSAAAAPSIPLAGAAAVFARAHALCSADGGRLWGVSLCGPLMLADPRTHQAIANAPIAGARRDGAYYRFTLPADEPIANAPFEYAGVRWAQVMWPLSGSTEARAVTLMHESFHRIQPRLGFVVTAAGDATTISGSEALETQVGRTMFRGELHALRVALVSTGAARKAALADALALRAYRDNALPATIAPEHELDIIEGLAESTGIDIALSPPKRIPYTLHDMTVVENSPSYAREFPYAIGPAYSELLDAADLGWRRHVTQASSIAALAARSYGIDVAAPSETQAQAILVRYGGVTIEREEAARALQDAARERRYQAEFVTGHTLRLPMMQFKINFNPSDVERFGDVGSVYHRMTVSAPWGTITVNGGDAMITGDFRSLTVAAPPSLTGSKIAGAGWVLTLASGARIVPDAAKAGSYTVASP